MESAVLSWMGRNDPYLVVVFASYVNNQRERYDFKFNGLFDAEAKQDKVPSAIISIRACYRKILKL